MDPIFIVFGVLGWLINILIVFYLIRFAVKADEQVEALKQINKKQDAQIDLLIKIAHQNENP